MALRLIHAFIDLLKDNNFVKVYDEHRSDINRSNTDYLEDFKKILEEKKFDFDKRFGYKGYIKCFGISSGDNDSTCYDIIHDNILKKENELVIFFENNFNYNYDKFKELKAYIEKDSNKNIIIVDDNKKQNNHSDSLSLKELEENASKKRNYFFLKFKPYTGYKFHHKLIIQYPKGEKIPVVYTGSFHFSENAIKNNSEIIIGIQSRKLSQDYLSSILWNSDLGNNIKLWNFLKDLHNQEFRIIDSKMILLADKILLRTQDNLNKYFFRMYSLIERLEDGLMSNDIQKLSSLKKDVTELLESSKDKDNEDEFSTKEAIDLIIRRIKSHKKGKAGLIIREGINNLDTSNKGYFLDCFVKSEEMTSFQVF